MQSCVASFTKPSAAERQEKTELNNKPQSLSLPKTAWLHLWLLDVLPGPKASASCLNFVLAEHMNVLP